ncbi:cytochrome P450 [Colletotrichum graminicola]|uniref:Cytochrome P450 n=1 Tax=Colletotrichum graminicola (strain M1.001 / M2 / FGSC 10212) TaxID=645133 RepID=E3QMB3_COLGM|nr:cytochrome P450 [Colletotrichum graminicola M1.001]EFQ32001.1 cytochrome P450 [Colletotrichum graminicola M1.001]WDK17123.1 cytochrome P450 [Colletotrichum graminicola]
MSRDYLAYASVAVSVLIAYSVASTVNQWLRLRHIKGPPSAGFCKWWLLRAVGGGRAHLDFYEACEKYGSIVRVGPNDLITSDPELMKRMLNVRTTYRRSIWYEGMRLKPGQDNVLSARDDELHHKLRSKMAAGYSGKEVENLEAKLDQNVLRLVDLLDKYVSEDKPFDFGAKAQYFTLDVISDLAFGEPFGDLATDSDVHEYIKTMEQNMPTIIVTSVLPWLLALLSSPLFRHMMPSEKDAIGVGKTMGIAKQVAAERFGPNKKVQKDMLGSFVARGLTQAEAESEILMQLLAGSDTTATAIRATILHVITNPKVTAALRAEIDGANLSRPVVSDAEARAMPYLQAVIKEGLRIFPPVVGQMSKEVCNGGAGDTFKGVHLPEGTRIGYCAWGIFRRQDIWGPDSHLFRPERWLEADAERLRTMEGTLELVFGYGKWQCLGRNVAWMELNKVFVELLKRFDLVLVDPTNPWHSVCSGVFLQSEYWIRGYRRTTSTGN